MNEIMNKIMAIEREQEKRRRSDELARYNKGKRVHKK